MTGALRRTASRRRDGRLRDRQRQRVYDWEASSLASTPSTLLSLPDAAALLDTLWRAERARYGAGRAPVPALAHGAAHRRRGFAFYREHRILLPAWTLTRWNLCHEAAHLLLGRDAEGHGARFVGVLIGLLARHDGRDAEALLASARAARLRVSAPSVGALPPRPVAEQLLALVRRTPLTAVEAAIELGLHWRQVLGHALPLVRDGRARWRGRQLHAVARTGGSSASDSAVPHERSAHGA